MQPQTKPTRAGNILARPTERIGASICLWKFRRAGHSVKTGQDNRAEMQPDLTSLLVAVARSQDRAAFAHLFGFFAPRIKALMMRRGASPARAEEISQDTMLAVWRKARLFDPDGLSASGWIYRIAKNIHIDGLRRDRRLTAIPADAEPEAVQQPDAIASTRDSEASVRCALAALSPEQLRVVTLSFFEDKPHAEIANELCIPLGTVKSRVRLAMQRLRDLLDDQ